MATYAFDLAALTATAKAIVLILSGLITVLARRAANRTGSSSLRLFSVGFAVITAGALVGGAVHQLAAPGLRVGVLVESLLTAIGFVLLAYSLYVTPVETSGGEGNRPT
jgi:hypothetical protein